MKSFFLWIAIFSLLVAKSFTQSGHQSVDSSQQRQKFLKCWSHSDCRPKECCAGLAPKQAGTCFHQPQLKEACNPRIRPGARECPCRLGLTCSTRRGKGGYPRCVYITLNPDEIDEPRSQSIY